MRLSKILILVIVIFTPSMAADQRTQIHLFRYAGDGSATAANAFDEFSYFLRNQVIALARKLDTSGSDCPPVGIRCLAIRPIPSNPPHPTNPAALADPLVLLPNAAAEQRYWYDTGALALLMGSIRHENGKLEIRSRVYWGEHIVDHRNSSEIVLPYVAETFDPARDSHAIAFLIAYARNLPSDCTHLSEQYAILSEASKRASAIVEDNEVLGDRLRGIVNAMLQDLDSKPCN